MYSPKNLRVILRPLMVKDAGISSHWRSDDEVVQNIVGPKRFVSVETEENWIRESLANPNRSLKLAICLKDSGKYVGNVYLEDIDQVNQNANFGILIGDEDYRGKGIGTEATMLMLHHAFYEMNLKRVGSLQLDTNLASIAMHRKCGFQDEGVLRRAAFKNGELRNLNIMGVLREDFEALLDS